MDRAFLERWSREWVAAHDPETDAPLDDEVRGGWLGFAPASPEQIAQAEGLLGCALPPSLRSFLLLTNGWKDAGDFIYRLAGTQELAWMRDTDDVHWAVADWAEAVERSLRISLAGDASILFLDPHDVNQEGEWAAYSHSSWSGEGPKRHDSFADLMVDLYARFCALHQMPGDDSQHAELDQACLAALSGEIDGPSAVFARAAKFGLERAKVLHFQLLAMQGQWHTVILNHLFFEDLSLADDPVFDTELVPLMFAEGRLMHYSGNFTLARLRHKAELRERIEHHEALRADPNFRQSWGNPPFDTAVQEIVDDLVATVPETLDSLSHESGQAMNAWLAAHPGLRHADLEELRRQRCAVLDAAWPRLLAAMSVWRPISINHLAPVVLLTEPLLKEMITSGRGKELLRMPRG